MPPGRRRHLTRPHEALLHDPDLVRIAPVPPARRIRGRKNFDLRSELMVGHKVGLITGGEIPSDGPRRRDTQFMARIDHLHQSGAQEIILFGGAGMGLHR